MRCRQWRRSAAAQGLLEAAQPRLHPAEDRVRRVGPVLARLAGGDAREHLDALLDALDGPHVELATLDGIRDVGAQHDVRDVGRRDHHALRAVEAARAADVEEALDLGGRATDRLYLAALVERAGDGDRLADGRLGERRQERVQLRRGRRVAVDVVVELLERQAGVERHRHVLPEAVREQAAQDQEPLVMRAAGHVALALDVDDRAAAGRDHAGDARRPPERDVAEVVDG